ncbi:MAG: methyltransferase domain-containing protein [Candidatus Melainabacteria bacterium]
MNTLVTVREPGRAAAEGPALACPQCHQPLAPDTEQQTLVCPQHGAFPHAQAIARFAGETDFDAHWQTHTASSLPAGKLAVATDFLTPLISQLHAEKNMTLLDVGCGDGVHVEVLAPLLNDDSGHHLSALDISAAALTAAQTHGNTSCRFVQADACALPFADQSFDVVFSFGVLAYTSNIRTAFQELCRVTKPGGLVGVWIYPQPKGLSGWLFGSVRNLCSALGPWLTRRIADCIVPLLPWLPTRSGLTLKNADWAACREVVLVNIQPRQLVFPEASEIRGWFTRHGLSIVHEDERAPVTLWGSKL